MCKRGNLHSGASSAHDRIHRREDPTNEAICEQKDLRTEGSANGGKTANEMICERRMHLDGGEHDLHVGLVLVCKARTLLCHSTLGLRVIKKKKSRPCGGMITWLRGTARAEDAQGKPTQCRISPSIHESNNEEEDNECAKRHSI